MTYHARQARKPSLLPLALLGAALLASLVTEDWIAGVAVIILWAGWHYLRPEVGPPVLSLAFSLQWVQVVGGIFYCAVTGRLLPTIYETDYRPMVLIGLGSLVAFLAGLRVGLHLLRSVNSQSVSAPICSWPTLLQLYIGSAVLNGFLVELAWRFPQLNQPILVFSLCRYGLMFLIFRRLTGPPVRWGWMGVILTGEILMGFTGFFAEFRDVLMIAALALLERFDRRQLRHWLGLGAMATLTLVTALVWTSIKAEYRGELTSGALSDSRLERLERVASLTTQSLSTDPAAMWTDADRLMERLWAVYYPALAVRRVPAVLPFANGAILGSAIWHILTPRILFPDKPNPPSESETVRKYSGVWVAGPEQSTTIAFGYVAESYVDFGIPLMFVPIFAFGLLMGAAYQAFLRWIHHQELAVAFVTVVFWLPLSQFDRSWLKMLGLSGTMILYLGAAAIILDRYLAAQRLRARRLTPQRVAGA